MNGYSNRVSKLTDAQLQAEIDTCSANWMDYASPATDKHYWYKALLEEQKYRKPKGTRRC